MSQQPAVTRSRVDPALLRAAPSAVAAHYGAGHWRRGTLLDDLRQRAAAHPGRIALDARQADGSTTRLDYAALSALTEQWAVALRGLGLGHGDTVVHQLPMCWQSVVLHLACLRAGVVSAPLGALIGPGRVEDVLRATGAALVITTGDWKGAARDIPVAEAVARLPRLRHRVVLGDAARTGALTFGDHFASRPDPARQPPAQRLPDPDPDRAACVLFTSGTTGRAKGVVHTANTLYAGARGHAAATAGTLGDPGHTTVCCAFTFGHLAGLVTGVWIPVLRGWTSVFTEEWQADTGLDLLAETGSEHLCGPPQLLGELLAGQRRRPRRLALRSIACGGAALRPGLAAEVRRGLGARLYSVWASTEAAGGTTTRFEDPDDWADHSDGSPVTGQRVRLVPDPAAPGSSRLEIRGPALAVASVEMGSGRLLWHQRDGWYDTGDQARLDGRGGIRIEGRVPDRINAPGNLMLPVRDLEDALRGHPAVREVVLVARATPEGTDVPVAVVACERGHDLPTAAALREYLLGLGQLPLPTLVVEPLDALPRNAQGKILRHELRERFGG